MIKPHKITVIGAKDSWYAENAIDVTSRAKGKWSGELSPFLLGPVKLYNNYISQNVENGYQYSKVYPSHFMNNRVLPEYFKWSKAGWSNKKAVRYPMSKGANPLFSLWGNKRLDYVLARKKFISLFIIKQSLKQTLLKS